MKSSVNIKQHFFVSKVFKYPFSLTLSSLCSL